MRILVKRAPEPSDIIWNNIGQCDKKKNQRRLLINLFILSIFLVSFGALVGIKRLIKYEQSASEQNLVSIGLSFVASTVVALTNTSIGTLWHS